MTPQIRQMIQTLMQTQGASRPAIIAYQHSLLEKLCRHARAHVPLYRDSGRLDALFRDEVFNMSGWNDVPVLSRAEAYVERDRLRADDVSPVMLPLTEGSTTGSTGTPLPFLRSELSRIVAEGILARALIWYGCGVMNPVVVSKAVTGDVAGRESAGTLAAHDGPVHQLDFVLPPAVQCAELARIGPRLVISYPSIVHSWVLADGGACLNDVVAIVLTGETCRDEVREGIRAVYGGHLINLYSASEAGPIAIQGPKGDLKVCEENVWLEDPPAATRARPHPVIVTPFYSYGTPLIRYAPGDYAVFGKPDPATPGLRSLQAITGRLRNMFKRPDGSLFWPNLSGAKMMKIALHTHRQLVQETLERFVLRIVFDAAPDDGQVARLKAHVAEVTGAREVVVEAVAFISDDRTRGKSYENFICLI